MKGIKYFDVRGMHCAACVALVRREFESVEGTTSASVDLKTGTATVSWEGESEVDDASYSARIAPYGYEAVRSEQLTGGASAAPPAPRAKNGKASSWLRSALVGGAILGLYWLVQKTGLADRASARSEASILTALFTGVAASVSSCLALVGSLVLALGSYGAGERGRAPLSRNLLFQAGRVAGFALLGGLLGLLGGRIAFSGTAVAVLTVAVGIITLALGLSLIGVIPTGFASIMPRRFSRSLDFLAASPHPAGPLVLGAATFFLPCGFTLSMQAFALASGSFATGSAIMAAFALGTSPVLFGVGLAGAWTKRHGLVLSRAAGLVVVAFSVQSILSAMPLFAYTGNVLDTAAVSSAGSESGKTAGGLLNGTNEQAVAGDVAEEGLQRVTMRVLGSSFKPAVIEVKAGIPVEWTIIGENPSGCTSRLLLPNMKEPLPIAKGSSQTVRFTADRSGTIPFSCWMGMVRGKIVVN